MKIPWNALRLSPLLLGFTLLLTSRAQADEVSAADLKLNVATTSQTTTSPRPVASSVQLLAQSAFSPAAGEPVVAPEANSDLSQPNADAFAQVTSVSQLSDVQPTDWAFQALQSLVERYGCIVGYPDGTYRGNRALTRYEFAAGVNACLDRVNELIAAATSDLVTREDLATLQRLQEEFAAELATLRGRVDGLEARTAELEANQFSTTTKLTGEVIAAVSDVFGDERAIRSRGTTADAPDAARGDLDVNTILTDRARLNFDTSFFGTDLLRTRLQARNTTPFTRTGTAGAPGDTGTAMTRLGFDGDEGNDVQLDDFFYRFQVADFARVHVYFANTEYNDSVSVFNSPFDSSGRGAVSRFGRFNPIYRQGDSSAGVVVNLLPEGPIGLSLGYLAPRASNPDRALGLFNGDYAALGQLEFRPTKSLNIGLTYVHSYDNAVNNASVTNNSIGLSGGTGSNFANNPFNGASTSANHYAVEGSFRVTPKITISGWGGLTYATSEDGDVAGSARGDEATLFNWAATLALTDLGKEGSVLGLIFGQPPKVTSNDFGVGAARTDSDSSYHLEALYRFPVTDNIEITPGAFVIFNPEGNSDNDSIYVGTIRTTFRF